MPEAAPAANPTLPLLPLPPPLPLQMQMMDRLKVETDDAQLTKLTNEALEVRCSEVACRLGVACPHCLPGRVPCQSST